MAALAAARELRGAEQAMVQPLAKSLGAVRQVGADLAGPPAEQLRERGPGLGAAAVAESIGLRVAAGQCYQRRTSVRRPDGHLP